MNSVMNDRARAGRIQALAMSFLDRFGIITGRYTDKVDHNG